MGCSQVVRQRFLVACTVGSNPTTPASISPFVSSGMNCNLSGESCNFCRVRTQLPSDLKDFRAFCLRNWLACSFTKTVPAEEYPVRRGFGTWCGIRTFAAIVNYPFSSSSADVQRYVNVSGKSMIPSRVTGAQHHSCHRSRGCAVPRKSEPESVARACLRWLPTGHQAEPSRNRSLWEVEIAEWMSDPGRLFIHHHIEHAALTISTGEYELAMRVPGLGVELANTRAVR